MVVFSRAHIQDVTMSKADYFRWFAIWNRPPPDTDQAGPLTVAGQTVEVASARIESVASVTVIDRPSAPPVTKAERRNLTAIAGDVSAPRGRRSAMAIRVQIISC
jgi:hypothetical protein